ncbi:MAG: DUF6242 domain-containing protein [Prevotella sp.]|nr:DUF6242 domain-containing protein [Prevotella sp.]
MRRFFFSIVAACLVLAVFVSCLSDDADYTYYDDAAITAFTLGTLNRYYTVEGSQGQDSTIMRTLSCTEIAFNIDQQAGLIWNSDSLPLGVDASKTVCTITSRNGGSVVYQSLISDTLFYYSSTDSIDFSTPRLFRVYGTSGLTYRDYTISVNVHKEVGDTCIWTLAAESVPAFVPLETMKALAFGGKMYVFGSDGSDVKIYTAEISGGGEWTEISSSTTLDADAVKSVTAFGDALYTYSGGEVLRSDDGSEWTSVAAADLKQIIGGGSAFLYALSSDGTQLLSSPDGATWTAEELDSDCSLLPSTDLSFAFHAMTTNASTEKLILIGNRDGEAYPSDTTAVVWTKVEEYAGGARANAWNYIPFAGDNIDNRAPRAENWQITSYDENNIKAVCGNGKDGGQAVALDRIYHSGDDGITWLNDTIMSIPDDLDSGFTSFAFAADGEGSVWLVCGGTGQVWKGRINRVAWKKEQDYFIE